MKSFKSFITVIVILSAAALILTACGGSSGGGNVTLSSIAVMPANPSIVVGASQQFTATGTYSDSSTQNITTSVTWSSSNTGVSTINTSGLAASVAAGTTTITPNNAFEKVIPVESGPSRLSANRSCQS